MATRLPVVIAAGEGQQLQAGDQLQINSHYGMLKVDTDGATITFDMAVSNKHTVTLGGNRILAVANDQVGQTFLVILQQDATGGRTISQWWPGILWTQPTLTTAANKRDVFMFLKLATGSYLGFTIGLNL